MPLPEQVMFKPLFDLVAPKDNWKKRIDAFVSAPLDAADYQLWCELMRRSVAFYTGSVATIVECGLHKQGDEAYPGRYVHVLAEGYYVAVGA